MKKMLLAIIGCIGFLGAMDLDEGRARVPTKLVIQVPELDSAPVRGDAPKITFYTHVPEVVIKIETPYFIAYKSGKFKCVFTKPHQSYHTRCDGTVEPEHLGDSEKLFQLFARRFNQQEADRAAEDRRIRLANAGSNSSANLADAELVVV